MLVEKTEVKSGDKAMMRQDKKSIFFLPKDESASMARTRPLIRHPMKKAEARRPVTIEPEHSEENSEMVDVCFGKSQSQ